MPFFRPNFEKPGPGIDKDAPPKKGLALFFEIFIREFWQLVKLNLIFLVSCIPIVTIGAALAGLSKSTTKMVRDVPNDVWYDFKTGFRENWKPATLCGAVGLLLLGGGFCGFFLYAEHPILQSVSLIALLLIASVWVYVYPMLTSTTLTLAQLTRNAMLLSVALFYFSLPAAVLCLLWIGAQIVFFPLSAPVTLFFGFSIPSFIASFAAWAGVKRYVIRDEDANDNS